MNQSGKFWATMAMELADTTTIQAIMIPRSTTQNSGVIVEAKSLHMSIAKDKNPIYAKMLYYGVNWRHLGTKLHIIQDSNFSMQVGWQ